MNAEQIRKCAEEIIRKLSGAAGATVYLNTPMLPAIIDAITRHLAAAKEAEDDVIWLRSCIAQAVASNRKMCHDVTTDRLVRILDRLERSDRENT